MSFNKNEKIKISMRKGKNSDWLNNGVKTYSINIIKDLNSINCEQKFFKNLKIKKEARDRSQFL